MFEIKRLQTLKALLIISLLSFLLVFSVGCNKQAADSQLQPDTSSNQSPISEDISKSEQRQEINTNESVTDSSQASPAINDELPALVSNETNPIKAEESTVKESDNSSEVIAEGSLLITGSGVESQKVFTLDQLKAKTASYYEADIFALNSYGTKRYFNFKGVKLWDILSQDVKLKKSASKVEVVSSDGYKKSFTLADIKKTDYIDEQDASKKHPVIIAWAEDGKDYDPSSGAPYRIVFGQKSPGDVNKPNWVFNIEKIVID